jgi:hypothetical protein
MINWLSQVVSVTLFNLRTIPERKGPPWPRRSALRGRGGLSACSPSPKGSAPP